jgi:hypothetical protein
MENALMFTSRAAGKAGIMNSAIRLSMTREVHPAAE